MLDGRSDIRQTYSVHCLCLHLSYLFQVLKLPGYSCFFVSLCLFVFVLLWLFGGIVLVGGGCCCCAFVVFVWGYCVCGDVVVVADFLIP